MRPEGLAGGTLLAMADDAYNTLAAVYDWLVPEALLTPEGAVEAFASVVEPLPPGARVLDCACGPGQLAVGLALRGFDVVACDASSAMVARALGLARERDAKLAVVACAWEELPSQGLGDFDAVFCVGNSLTHAAGTQARRRALTAMASVLRRDGLLVVTSRNWELVRAAGAGLKVADALVERGAERALVIYGWTIAAGWDDPHDLDVAVSLIGDDGSVSTRGERLRFWPFTAADLDADLRAAGLTTATTTYAPDAERYLVTAVSA
jgi:SAM-dependent methyltransferase